MGPDMFRVVTIDSDGTTASAACWRDAVGEFVDVVPLHPTIAMWVNDTGLVDALPINWVATTIARAFGLTHQSYAGPVVFTGGTDDGGTTLPLGDHQTTTLLRADAITNHTHTPRLTPPRESAPQRPGDRGAHMSPGGGGLA